MKRLIILIEVAFIVAMTAFVFYKCASINTEESEQLYRHIGDINYDPLKDNEVFQVCNEDYIFQYFNNGSGPEYIGEKIAIEEHFHSSYQPIELFEENGWIRIRFVVNCHGDAGRFRIIASDFNYQEKAFDERITGQLLDLTKAISKWPKKKYRKLYGDYYMYLIFKIKDGQLIEILP